MMKGKSYFANLFADLKSHGWKYCLIIYYERKTLLGWQKKYDYKTSELSSVILMAGRKNTN